MLKKILGVISKPEAPINCGCSRTYCSSNCGSGIVGTKVNHSYDCVTGTSCGTVQVGSYCACRL